MACCAQFYVPGLSLDMLELSLDVYSGRAGTQSRRAGVQSGRSGVQFGSAGTLFGRAWAKSARPRAQSRHAWASLGLWGASLDALGPIWTGVLTLTPRHPNPPHHFFIAKTT